MKAGMPEELADLLSSSDAVAAQGAMDDGGRQLSKLIGRPTTPYRAVVEKAIASL